MIVCYAHGDGLGHLTRIRAALHTLRRGEPATILTGSPFAVDPRVVGTYSVVSAPTGLDRDRLSRWIGATLTELAPDEVIVDAFPAGLTGELASGVVPPDTRITHLARLLRWDAYRPVLPAEPLRFDQTWLVEPVTAEHRTYLSSVSSALASLPLVEPPVEVPDDPSLRPLAEGRRLVVHAGPVAEVLDLIGYARDTAVLEGIRPALTLISPRLPPELPPDVTHVDVYPAWPLFPLAERIITAAGCNAVRQLAPWRSRHRMIPFPRRFDDQFARAARSMRRTERG